MAKGKNPFEKLLEEINEKTSGKGGVFYHPTPGKTKCRIILPEGNEPTEFYREVINRWNKTRYMVAAVILEAPDWVDDKDEPKEPELRALVLPTTAFKDVVGLLAEGFELFDPEGGHGISVSREGTGKFDTTYSVNPSPRPIDLTSFDVSGEMPEGGMDEWAEAYNQRNNDTGTSGEETREEKPEKKGKAGLPW